MEMWGHQEHHSDSPIRLQRREVKNRNAATIAPAVMDNVNPYFESPSLLISTLFFLRKSNGKKHNTERIFPVLGCSHYYWDQNLFLINQYLTSSSDHVAFFGLYKNLPSLILSRDRIQKGHRWQSTKGINAFIIWDYKLRIISKLVEGQRAGIFKMPSDSRVPGGKSPCLQS